jgi:hypothetical protein
MLYTDGEVMSLPLPRTQAFLGHSYMSPGSQHHHTVNHFCRFYFRLLPPDPLPHTPGFLSRNGHWHNTSERRLLAEHPQKYGSMDEPTLSLFHIASRPWDAT